MHEARVARNLGKTLRAFQPTIRELQEVPKDFKSTLEQEIGIDEVVSPRNYINKSALHVDEKQETVDCEGKEEQQLAASDAISKGITSQKALQKLNLAAMTTETSIVQSDVDTQSSEKSDNQR
ncbi:sec-independent protein translocase protein TATB, chloroplastic-like [Zingiber officinale]|uniref:sec-independent protein translocase protein TATB, chloroplastic-like n=1 Tax=Zingiber officinale TaxID=94328 RepID=UPI001C4B029B|nr:sec-independent protein translocase protein TATB, chloroplastic-like [Zingiber officinale]